MLAKDLAILERPAEEHPDPAVRRALRAALDELGGWPRQTWGHMSTKPREELTRCLHGCGGSHTEA